MTFAMSVSIMIARFCELMLCCNFWAPEPSRFFYFALSKLWLTMAVASYAPIIKAWTSRGNGLGHESPDLLGIPTCMG